MDINRYKGIVFDLDGVVWLRRAPVPGVPETINILRSRGLKPLFVTNNAGEHREYQWNKLRQMGIPCDLSEVVTSGYATARHLLGKYGPSRIFVMGTNDLGREMTDAGHTLVEEHAQFVVVGFDPDFNYQKLDRAFNNVHFQGSRFIACNENPVYPAEDGVHPGVGPSVKALACAVGREPDLVVGKPHKHIMDVVAQLMNLPALDCLVVGDMLELDILAGINAGMDTAYVLSGIGKRDDILRLGITPTYVLNSAADLLG